MNERSLGEVGELARQTTVLIRQEILLAKVELGQKAREPENSRVDRAGGAILYADCSLSSPGSSFCLPITLLHGLRRCWWALR
jgi:hypothetical protein